MSPRKTSGTPDYSQNPDVTTRTREILHVEPGYRDGPPYWRTGKARRPAQTADEAYDARLKRIRRIRRNACDHRAGQALADRLDTCAPDQRCMSAACPECGRAYCRWFVTSASTFFEALGADVTILSLVHAGLSVPVGQMTPDHLYAANRRIQTMLTGAGVTTFAGGVDFSVNEDESGAIAPHIQPHSWILAPAKQICKAEGKLRAMFPRTETTRRPVSVKPWDGNPAALAYALKTDFARRVSYHREANIDGSKHACRNTRDRHLRVDQHLELLITLDRAGLHARLHLGGCRVVHTTDGPMIRPIGDGKGRA